MSETASTFDLRRTILDHARKVMVSEAYGALSMRKIATRAGYSATAIYLHFKNKDDLLHALIEEGFDKLHNLLSQSVQQVSDPLEKIENMSRSFIEFGLNQPEYYEIMFLMHPEQMKRYPAEKYRKARRTIHIVKEILDEAALSGRFNIDRPDLEAYALWSSIHGAISAIHAGRLDSRINRDEFLETVVQGLLKRFS